MAETELGAQLVTIKKTSPEYAAMQNPPPCPSVEVDGKLIAINDTATYEQIKTAMGA